MTLDIRSERKLDFDIFSTSTATCNRGCPSTGDGNRVPIATSRLANHRTSIAIRRYPERFVCAITSDAREHNHLLLSQHARKKARDNYYGEYASPLSLSFLSFPLVTMNCSPLCCSPIPLIYTPFSSTSAFPIAVTLSRVIISFIFLVLRCSS